MFYSQRPPRDYEQAVELFFAKDEAHWNLLWLFYPRMDRLNDIRATQDNASLQALTDWLGGLDTTLSASCTVDLEHAEFGLREQVCSLTPMQFMDWLWQQPYKTLAIYGHVGMDGMNLATKRAQWLDATVDNPPAAEVIAIDFKRRA